MLNLDIFKDYILESRRNHSSLPKDIESLLDKDYELLADPITTDTGIIYILKQLETK